jgi:hypothetical protein
MEKIRSNRRIFTEGKFEGDAILFQKVARVPSRRAYLRYFTFVAAVFLCRTVFGAEPEPFASSPPDNGPAYSLTVFGGVATDTNFTQTFYEPWTVNFVDIQFAGAAFSTRLGTLNDAVGALGWDWGSFGDDIKIDPEIGVGARFGDGNIGEVWGALYFRYDNLPWNDTVYTTFAIDTGLSLLSAKSEFEDSRSDTGTSQLLHYFSPEVTFADPDYKDIELVFRLHHRSGIFGLMDGVTTGSSFVTMGMRVRF